MRRRVLGGALLVAALATGTAWWTLGGTPDGEVGPGPVAGPARDVSEALVLDAPTDTVNTRVKVEPPPEAPATRSPPPEDLPVRTGVVRVTVRSSDTGRVVPGERVYATVIGAEHGVDVDRSSGVLGEALLTDEHGRVEYAVPLNQALNVFMWSHDQERTVLPLVSPRVVELELSIPTAPDLLFTGRVVDAETGRPLPGARVLLTEWPSSWITTDGASRRANSGAPSEQVPVDSAGYFVLERGSWEEEHLEVTAPGRAPAYLLPRSGFESRASARVVSLQRAATLAVLVEGGDGLPLADALVVAEVDCSLLSAGPADKSWSSHVRWSCVTTIEGRCSLVGLPPGVELRVGLAANSGAGPALVVELEPGEHRELALAVDG